EGKFEVLRVDHLRAIAEAAAIFVMRIQEKYPDVGAGFENLMQKDSNSARLADAGRTQNREMLVQHVVHIDMGTDGMVLMEVADIDDGGCADREGQPQLRRAGTYCAISDRRMVDDTALEARIAPAMILDFPKHVEVGRDRAALAIGDCSAL